MTRLREAASLGGSYEALQAELPPDRTDGPSLAALLRGYAELRRVARERRHADDQAALGIGPDPKRGGLLPKPQGKGNPGGKPCQPKD